MKAFVLKLIGLSALCVAGSCLSSCMVRIFHLPIRVENRTPFELEVVYAVDSVKLHVKDTSQLWVKPLGLFRKKDTSWQVEAICLDSLAVIMPQPGHTNLQTEVGPYWRDWELVVRWKKGESVFGREDIKMKNIGTSYNRLYDHSLRLNRRKLRRKLKK